MKHTEAAGLPAAATMSAQRLTDQVQARAPDDTCLRNNARPRVACNALFGETMLRPSSRQC
jgi:hypothetical protein